MKVDPGSSLSFTKTNFNSIQITAAEATADTGDRRDLYHLTLSDIKNRAIPPNGTSLCFYIGSANIL
ncbi:S-Ena type endospore appendage [Paenibacillus sp. Y412MC10]|uniref:S-Ena type endospore appendage n=1 Tax=Geobacillus sp. (strain Y412MC10) TaxID=481743 RepID=UPI0037CAD6F1